MSKLSLLATISPSRAGLRVRITVAFQDQFFLALEYMRQRRTVMPLKLLSHSDFKKTMDVGAKHKAFPPTKEIDSRLLLRFPVQPG